MERLGRDKRVGNARSNEEELRGLHGGVGWWLDAKIHHYARCWRVQGPACLDRILPAFSLVRFCHSVNVWSLLPQQNVASIDHHYKYCVADHTVQTEIGLVKNTTCQTVGSSMPWVNVMYAAGWQACFCLGHFSHCKVLQPAFDEVAVAAWSDSSFWQQAAGPL